MVLFVVCEDSGSSRSWYFQVVYKGNWTSATGRLLGPQAGSVAFVKHLEICYEFIVPNISEPSMSHGNKPCGEVSQKQELLQ